ncbi:bifunctional 4-hydroxy-2-oxoglutarate aldolase/2-dehydro-3-deoxy-phosphogluconate aldolase [Auraticoccus sp. F435]|uniref:Bifunctional 4-hydroxy-2-oxoglutarate aldolase/2-dehydro-3-deoxy-phosphogluconate aldolase n=1 Tax=Auraticoccus cholistanensis TaxID=2656650 RepID=A0A6A9UPV9_9ACTN|nr:bifunctional 4-hydroxy-2-oxoglutarate aldolase/2-dehydro-3-deoxy-phosphogluconate aldolase [Auraticoccus cholistanensis]MVA74578.1 bifunctional 4-hydroxy-2-oxoglutarate aldolase/2-dehydro-3-deoxy-phosphogluconate aldolase [Auraticoccus cholistanensis]
MTTTLDELARTGVIAVLRAPSAQSALEAVEALVAGGVTGVEVTYSTPGAPAVIAELGRRHGDAIVLGAGTITTPQQAEQAAAAGARFLVSPGTSPGVVAAMKATGLVTMSGVLTPSEVMTAVELGVDVCKLFPASLGGPAFLKALRGPFPDVVMMPTGGVSPDNVSEWVAAGALAVGAGSDLVPPAALASGDLAVVRERAAAFAAAWREVGRG